MTRKEALQTIPFTRAHVHSSSILPSSTRSTGIQVTVLQVHLLLQSTFFCCKGRFCHYHPFSQRVTDPYSFHDENISPFLLPNHSTNYFKSTSLSYDPCTKTNNFFLHTCIVAYISNATPPSRFQRNQTHLSVHPSLMRVSLPATSSHPLSSTITSFLEHGDQNYRCLLKL